MEFAIPILAIGGWFVSCERKPNSKPNLTSLLNPYKTEKIGKLVNINTIFRQNYYNTSPTDFVFDLAATLNNVTSISLETAEIPKSNYTYSDFSKTTEFTVELYDKSSNFIREFTLSAIHKVLSLSINTSCIFVNFMFVISPL